MPGRHPPQYLVRLFDALEPFAAALEHLGMRGFVDVIAERLRAPLKT
jgi:hypothetical protein